MHHRSASHRPDPRGLRLLLARHGATAWNGEQRYLGRTDLDLNTHGIEQAQHLAEWLRSTTINGAIVDGSRRSSQTLERAAGSIEQIVDQRWRERDYGAWEGHTYNDLLHTWPEQARAHWAEPWNIAPPQGETLSVVASRVRAATDDLIAGWAGRTVLLIASATPLQLLLCDLLGTPPAQHWRWKLDLGSLSCVELYASGPIVNWLNRGYMPPPACD